MLADMRDLHTRRASRALAAVAYWRERQATDGDCTALDEWFAKRMARPEGFEPPTP